MNDFLINFTWKKVEKISKSFVQDIKVLEKGFYSEIEDIYLECKYLKKSPKKSLEEEDGIVDSINTCFV